MLINQIDLQERNDDPALSWLQAVLPGMRGKKAVALLLFLSQSFILSTFVFGAVLFSEILVCQHQAVT